MGGRALVFWTCLLKPNCKVKRVVKWVYYNNVMYHSLGV